MQVTEALAGMRSEAASHLTQGLRHREELRRSLAGLGRGGRPGSLMDRVTNDLWDFKEKVACMRGYEGGAWKWVWEYGQRVYKMAMWNHAQVRRKMGLVMLLNGCKHGNEGMGIK